MKGGPPAGLAFHLNPAARLHHDAVDGGESQARPVFRFFRGEERLEDVDPSCFVHAEAVVAYGEPHAFVQRRFPRQVLCDERQGSTAGHRIAGVDDEIHQNLFDLRRVRSHRT